MCSSDLALISAREALTQGRPLWAMPGDVLRSSARGSNQLLQQGAHPLLDVTAWVHALGPCPLPAASCQREQRLDSAPLDSAPHAAQGQQRLAELDPALVALLEDGASLPRLASQLGRSSSQLAEQLVQLELEGVLTAEPGMRWRLA